MEKENQLWNEYVILRDEIKSADAVKTQIMGFVVAAVAAILVKSFDQPDLFIRAFILICVYLVTIPGYRLLLTNQRRTWRNSTYIRTFLEPELEHINWESRLCDQRIRAGSDKSATSVSSLGLKNEWFLIFLMNTVASLAAIGTLLQNAYLSYKSWVAANHAHTPVAFIISLILIFVVSMLYLLVLTYTLRKERTIRRGGEVEKTFFDSWDAIKNSANSTSS